MISYSTLLVISVAYVAVLFAVAYRGDRRASHSPGAPRHALIYALALSTYCTSWTFYGAVGRATSQGWDFLPIYLGPACAFLFCYPLFQRIIQVSKHNNITSIADFIGARYGRHQILPQVVTLIATLGIVPYIALQLKAVAFGFDVLVQGPAMTIAVWSGTPLAVAFVMAVFAILFGTRELSATENHHGMVLALAFESLVKLIAFIAVGLYATALVLDVANVRTSRIDVFKLAATYSFSPSSFFVQSLLAAFAIICLPRQFHIAVVEHASTRDLRTARWIFPGYLFCVSIFVIPIAEAGRRYLHAPISPDTFVLALPLERGMPWLGLVAYVGGFSASTGMVIVETIAIATMISNEIVMPLFFRFSRSGVESRSIPVILKSVRRVSVVLVMGLAYLYYWFFTGQGTLTQIGLLSFAAVAQFAPGLLGGVLWKGGSYVGTTAGLVGGAIVWAYTLLAPVVLQSGNSGIQFLARGPFELVWLRPQALFGAQIDDPLTHGVFWSLLVNVVLYVGISSLKKPGFRDLLQAANFLSFERAPALAVTESPNKSATVGDLKEMADRFLGADKAHELFEGHLPHGGPVLHADRGLSRELARTVEHALAGVIGASSARLVLSTTLRGRNMRPEDVVRLLDESSHTILFTRELLRTALENLPQGISVVDDGLKLVAWNQRYAALFDYPDHLIVIGRPIEDLIRFNATRGWLVTSDLEQSIARRLSFMRAGEPYIHEREMPNGTVLEMRGNPLPGGGFVTSYSDVTGYRQEQAVLRQGNTSLELRVNERTLELLKLNAELGRSKTEVERAHLSKTRFLAAASHDLAQPITAARLFISSVNTRGLPSPADGLIAKAEIALSSAEDMLRSLLEFSRLDGGAEKCRLEHFNLANVIQPLLSDFAPAAERKGLKLRFVNCNQIVHSDPHLLRRVLQNFVANAVKYTEHGRVVVGCRRRGENVEIHVFDTGPGIPRELQRDAFQPYRQLTGGNEFRQEGLGLGLAIAARISDLMGQPISVRSVQDKGSNFSIRVPQGVANRITERQRLARFQTADSFAGKTVVCVEDERSVLDALQALLASWGCTPHGYADAERVVSAATVASAPDLLILDYDLGKQDTGVDVARKLKALWNKKVPVIFLTAADLRDHQVRSDEGAVRILRKPLKPGALRALMDVLLR